MAPYQLLDEIGRGGMGVVHRARHVELGRDVALKVLLPDMGTDQSARVRFVREIQSLMALDHPNIVKVLDCGDLDGQNYYAMEIVAGHSLKDLLAGTGALPLRRALGLGLQAASALAACHAAHIVHRDVKPGNLMVGPEDHLTLMDFGLIRVEGGTILTSTGQTIGSPRYMPPEAFGEGASGAPADVYALGITILEMLAGRNPFRTSCISDLMVEIIHQGPIPLGQLRPDVPPDVMAVLERMVLRSPAARPTMAQVVTGLGKCLTSQPPRPLTGGSSRRMAGPGARPVPARALPWRAIAFGVVLGSLLLAFAARRGGRPAEVVTVRSPAPPMAKTQALARIDVQEGERCASIVVVQEGNASFDLRLERKADHAALWTKRIRPDPRFQTTATGLETATTYRLSLTPVDPHVTYLGGAEFKTAVSGMQAHERRMLDRATNLAFLVDVTRVGSGSPKDPELLPLILAQLKDPAIRRSEAAVIERAHGLAEIGDSRALGPMVDLLESLPLSAEARARLVGRLGRLRDPAAFDAIVAQRPRLELAGPEVWRFPQALVHCDRRRARRYFEQALKEPAKSTVLDRNTAIIGMYMGCFRDLAPLATTAALASEAPDFVGLAVHHLARIGGDQARNSVREIYRGWKARGRRDGLLEAAVLALGVAGDATDSVELVTLLTVDSPTRLREKVAQALGMLGGNAATGPLIKLLGDPDPSIRRAATVAVARLGLRDAVEPLVARLAHESTGFGRVPRALGLINDPRAVSPLLALVSRPPPPPPPKGISSALVDRAETLWALGWMKAPGAYDVLCAGLDSPVPYVQYRAAEGLGLLGDPRAERPLAALGRRLGHSARGQDAVRFALGLLSGKVRRPREIVAVDPTAMYAPLRLALRPGESRGLRVQGAWARSPKSPRLLDALGERSDVGSGSLVVRICNGPNFDAYGAMQEPSVGSWLGAAGLLLVEGELQDAFGFMMAWVEEPN